MDNRMGFFERYVRVLPRWPLLGGQAGERETLRFWIERAARRYSERPALQAGERRMTFRDWNARANQYARWARTLPLTRGDVVALQSHDWIECFCAFTGFAKIGVGTLLLDPSRPMSSIIDIVATAKPRAAIVDAGLLKDAVAAFAEREWTAPVYTLGKADCAGAPRAPQLDLLLRGFSKCDIPPDARVRLTGAEIALVDIGLEQTSRTRGRDQSRILKTARELGRTADLRRHDRLLILSQQPCSAALMTVAFANLAKGGACVAVDYATIAEDLNSLSKHECSLMAVDGEALAAVCAIRRDARLFNGMRTIFAADLSSEAEADWRVRHPATPLIGLR